ncbi:MAG: prepilin-type N-terminal cleavage/methylation domain-containing protein [Candidatus Pacebacteria bacterium]|nr:prepilin-type N-terminal cleavage/methylation domain-containing protein [Candidatus Paceibacterota bacterium]
MITDKFKNGQIGFTLIETLVSLVILTLTLIPILNLSNSINRVTESIQDNMIASGLAQEGIEIIRNMRDTNWFNNRAFDLNLGEGVVNQPYQYRVEWQSVWPGTYANTPLNISNGMYTYFPGEVSKFTRTITITKINAGELSVVSQVSWTDGRGNSRSISAEDHLFNWK